jgi:hypothetical protein
VNTSQGGKKRDKYLKSMSYTEFNPKQNSLKVLREPLNSWDKVTEEILENQEYFFLLKESSRTVGIKINNFLSKVELKGYRAETLFKELLDQISIPYLNIGQSPIDHSLTLQASNSKRPDFLLNIPNLGIIMIDVKCRRKMGFVNNEENYFQINKDEIDQLFNLNQNLLTPVWIAFLDQSEIFHIHDKEKQKSTFYLVPIVELKHYLENLRSKLSKRESLMISSIRLPNELLSEFSGDLNLKFGNIKITENTIEKFILGYKSSLIEIEKLILNHIRGNKCYKTKLSSELRVNFMLMNEIDHILALLIQENIVHHVSREPLRLMDS